MNWTRSLLCLTVLLVAWSWWAQHVRRVARYERMSELILRHHPPGTQDAEIIARDFEETWNRPFSWRELTQGLQRGLEKNHE